MTKHTPTPWKVNTDDKDEPYIYKPDGEPADITWVNGDEGKEQDLANANYIVRAVNSYEELLAALKEASQLLEFLGKEIKYKTFDLTDKVHLFSQIGFSVGKFERAIAKAEAGDK